jgi:hypothetical protein
MQRAIHYDLQELEFQSIANKIRGHFRMTRTWQRDTDNLGLQT